MKRIALLVLFLCVALLAACRSGPEQRVSPPAASIQQLTVRSDGSWSVDLRLENFSGMPMRFDAVSLAMTLDGEPAGTLQGSPAISIGQQSADITTLLLVPASNPRMAMADALAGNRPVTYTLEGTITAAPVDGKPRSYPYKRNNSLNPVPGLPGVLR